MSDQIYRSGTAVLSMTTSTRIVSNFLSLVSSRQLWMIMVVGILIMVGTAGAVTWTTNGSDGWNGSIGNGTVVRGDQNITLDLFNNDYISWWDMETNSTSRTTLWDVNRTSAQDGSFVGSVVWNSTEGLDFTAGYIDMLLSGGTLPSNYPISIIMDADVSNTGARAIGGFFNSSLTTAMYAVYDQSSVTNLLTTNTFGTAGTIDTSNRVKITAIWANNTYRALYVNGVLDISNTTSKSWTPLDRFSIGHYGDLTPGVNFTGTIYSIAQYNKELEQSEISNNLSYKSTGNRTFSVDFGSGRQGSQIMINFTNLDANLTADLHASTDNFSASDELVQIGVTSGTWNSIISAKNQTQYVRLVLNGNDTETPRMTEISVVDEASALATYGIGTATVSCSDKIYISSGWANTYTLVNKTNNISCIQQLTDTTYLLNLPIQINSNGIYYINDTDTTWLKMNGTNVSGATNADTYIFGSSTTSQIWINNTKITSWNTTLNSVGEDTYVRRPAIAANGYLNARNSNLSYLGPAYTAGGLNQYGISAYYAGSLIQNNTMLHNYIHVVFKGNNISILDNYMEDIAQEGTSTMTFIQTGDVATNTTITGNTLNSTDFSGGSIYIAYGSIYNISNNILSGVSINILNNVHDYIINNNTIYKSGSHGSLEAHGSPLATYNGTITNNNVTSDGTGDGQLHGIYLHNAGSNNITTNNNYAGNIGAGNGYRISDVYDVHMENETVFNSTILIYRTYNSTFSNFTFTQPGSSIDLYLQHDETVFDGWYVSQTTNNSLDNFTLYSGKIRFINGINGTVTFQDFNNRSQPSDKYSISWQTINNTYNNTYNIIYTTNKIFNDSIGTITTYYPTNSSASIISNSSNTISYYNMTLQPSQNNVTATNTTSVLTVNYQNNTIPRLNITFGSPVPAMNITLNNVTTGANYSLYYAGNDTWINSTIAQSPVYFNLSLGNNDYYITEDLPETTLPNITSWENNKTLNTSLDFTINTSESVKFNITVNQSITTYNWYINGTDQSNNFDNFTTSWGTAGLRTVVVNATNSNGTSGSIQWNVTVDTQEIELNVYNNIWQYILVNSTITINEFNDIYDTNWIAHFNVDTQEYEEIYKSGWPIYSAFTISGGEGIAVKFTTNKTITMSRDDSYNWVLSEGWNLQGIELTKTLSEINTSINTACEMDQILFTNLSTEVESIYTCGSSNNGTTEVKAGEAVFIHKSTVGIINTTRVW